MVALLLVPFMRWFSLSLFDKFTGSRSIFCRLGQLFCHSVLTNAFLQPTYWPLPVSMYYDKWLVVCFVGTSVCKVLLYLTATCACVHLKCSLVWVEKNAMNSFFTDKKIPLSDPHHEYLLYSTKKECHILCSVSVQELLAYRS